MMMIEGQTSAATTETNSCPIHLAGRTRVAPDDKRFHKILQLSSFELIYLSTVANHNGTKEKIFQAAITKFIKVGISTEMEFYP